MRGWRQGETASGFSPLLWDRDADGVKGTAARMEQLCVHALLVQLYAKQLVAEGEIPPAPGAKGFGGAGKQSAVPADELKAPVWLGKDLPAAMSAGWHRRQHQRQLAAGLLAIALTAGGSGGRSAGMVAGEQRDAVGAGVVAEEMAGHADLAAAAFSQHLLIQPGQSSSAYTCTNRRTRLGARGRCRIPSDSRTRRRAHPHPAGAAPLPLVAGVSALGQSPGLAEGDT